MPNGGRGNRNMYYLTGLPGWMRFGFSPGWQGRSPTGLGPGATYLMTGQWPTPQAQAYWQAMQAGQAPYPFYGAPATAPGMTREQELDFLKNQADVIKGQLEQIEARMRELETKKEK
jgi:hypothetical protein